MYESPSIRSANDDFMSRLAKFKASGGNETEKSSTTIASSPQVPKEQEYVSKFTPWVPVIQAHSTPSAPLPSAAQPSVASFVSALTRTPRVLGAGFTQHTLPEDKESTVVSVIPREVPGWPPKVTDSEVIATGSSTKVPSLSSTLNRTRHSITGLLSTQSKEAAEGGDNQHADDLISGSSVENVNDLGQHDSDSSESMHGSSKVIDRNGQMLAEVTVPDETPQAASRKASMRKTASTIGGLSKSSSSFRRPDPRLISEPQCAPLADNQSAVGSATFLPSASISAAATLLLQAIDSLVKENEVEEEGHPEKVGQRVGKLEYSLIDYLIDRQIQHRHDMAESKLKANAQRNEIDRYRSAMKGLTVSKGFTTNAKMLAHLAEHKQQKKNTNLSDAINSLYSEKSAALQHSSASGHGTSSAFHDPRYPLLSAAHRKEVLRLYEQASRGKDLLRIAAHLIRETCVQPFLEAPPPSDGASSQYWGVPNTIVDALADLTSRIGERRKERELFLTHYQRAMVAAEKTAAAEGKRADSESIKVPQDVSRSLSHTRSHSLMDDEEKGKINASYGSPTPKQPSTAFRGSALHQSPIPMSYSKPAARTNVREASLSSESYLKGAIQYLQSLQFDKWVADGGNGPIPNVQDAHRQHVAELATKAQEATDDAEAAETQRLALGLRGKGEEAPEVNKSSPSERKGRARRDTAYPRNGNIPQLLKSSNNNEEDNVFDRNPYGVLQRRGLGGVFHSKVIEESQSAESEEYEEEECSSQYLEASGSDGEGDGIKGEDTPTPLQGIRRNKSAFERICQAAQAQHPLALDEEMARREKLRQLFVEDVQNQAASLSIPGRKLAATLPKEFTVNSLSRALNPTIEKNPYRFSPPAAQRCMPGGVGNSPSPLKIKNRQQNNMSSAAADDAGSTLIRRRRSVMGGSGGDDTASRSSRALTHRSKGDLGENSLQLTKSASVRFVNEHQGSGDWEGRLKKLNSTLNPLNLVSSMVFDRDDATDTISNAATNSTVLSPPQSSRRKAAEGGVRFAAVEDSFVVEPLNGSAPTDLSEEEIDVAGL